MKQPILTLFGLLMATTLFAQRPDSAQAIVHYKFSWVRDTNNRDKPYTENMVLLIGKNASLYKSYDRSIQMAEMRKDMAAQAQAGSGQITVHSRGTSTMSELYQFPNDKKLIRKEKLMTTYLIDEPFPAINWKITSDTSTIRNLSCQKATGHFKGRDYTAWFCADLPYQSGPWKLNGLPGLIIEAYDTKKEVSFKFDGIEQISKADKPVAEATPTSGTVTRVIINGVEDTKDDPTVIALPDNGVKTTVKEYDNLREAMRKDPNAFIQAAMAGSGMVPRPGAVTTNITRINSATPPPVNNNPIELPEK
jgi:GLPGLI family protein